MTERGGDKTSAAKGAKRRAAGSTAASSGKAKGGAKAGSKASPAAKTRPKPKASPATKARGGAGVQGPRLPAAQSRRQRAVLWTLVASLIVVAGAAVMWSVWPYVRDEFQKSRDAVPLLADRVTALEARVDDVETRLARLPDADAVHMTEAATGLLSEKAAGLTRRVDEMESTLAGLKSRLNEIRAAPAPARQPDNTVAEAARNVARDATREAAGAGRAAARNADEIAALEKRLAALESAPPAAAGAEVAAAAARRQALVVAVGQLREALRTPQPFAAEVDTIRSLAGGDAKVAEALTSIAPRADRGIPTTEDLRTRFTAVADAAVKARPPGKGKAGWVDEAITSARDLVTVRRTGPEVPGDTPEAVVARAEARVKSGDLAGAVRELAALNGPAAAAVADWLKDARARVAAEAALKTLHAYVLGQIAKGGAPEASAPR